MYDKIGKAKKSVDDNAPKTSMFRRSYFNRVGREPWQLVALRPNTATAKVDCSPPDSFPYLQSLYINKPKRLERRKASRPATAEKLSATALAEATLRSASSIRPHAPSESYSNSIGNPHQRSVGELLKAKKALNSMDAYLVDCDRRKGELREELVKISARRARRQGQVTGESVRDWPGSQSLNFVPSPPKMPKSSHASDVGWETVTNPQVIINVTSSTGSTTQQAPMPGAITRSSSHASLSRVNSVLSNSSAASGGQTAKAGAPSPRQLQAAVYLTDLKRKASISRFERATTD
eukprot:GILI01028129.1.p1 GENE.GILI01028129.1~~GILI01028129.1.p1  ORF type:complete len:311 (-),score=52.31 GILI01028129.1:81-959(-)